MKSLAGKTATTFVICLSLCAPLRTADLLAHADDQTLWIAQVEQIPTLRTTIRYRAVGGELQWREFPRLTGRAIDLASRGASLAVLMENGEWLLVWPGQYSTGPALPEGARMIALAGHGDSLFAIGLTGGPRAATAPATRSTSDESFPTTAPATAPVERLALFQFSGSAWARLADLPDDISPRTADPALAIIDRQPVIAVTAPDQAVRIIELTAQKTWVERGTVAPGFTPRQFQLVSLSQRPLLWIAGNSDAGVICRGGERWSPPVKLELTNPIASPRGRAFVLAAGNLRLLLEDEAGRIFEQCYRPDGARTGDLTELPAPRPSGGPAYNNWSMIAVTAAVVFILFSSVRRRSPEEEAKLGAIPLAPVPLRLLAGMIDLLPILVTAAALQIRAGTTDPAEIPPRPMIVAAAVYFAHTLIGELAMGRSIGKMIVGLRVTRADGRPPGAGAILVRNLMRTIDLFPPLLVLILFTPLRQRMGDIVAGTIVVTNRPPEPPEKPDSGDHK